MPKPTPTQRRVLEVMASSGNPVHWTQTMFAGFSGGTILGYAELRISDATLQVLARNAWIVRAGGQRPIYDYRITPLGRTVVGLG